MPKPENRVNPETMPIDRVQCIANNRMDDARAHLNGLMED
jgi:hypothetical protein